MNESPAISVVMSIFKEPEQWLRASIESILSQTYPDFEFVIINDNPDSETNKNLLQKYSESDSRIKVISNEVQSGLTKSLNTGLQFAKGQYVARMDADDISTLNRLELQKGFLDANPEYIACGSSVFKILENNETKDILSKPKTDEEIKSSLFFESPMVHPSLFFRRIDNQFMPYDTSYRYCQDYDYISKLAVYGKLYNFQNPLLYYRFSDKQITFVNRNLQNNLGHTIRNRNIVNYLSEKYNVKIDGVFGKDSVQLSSDVLKLLKRNRADNRNLSAVLYSILFYSDINFFERSLCLIKSVFVINIQNKYRIRLLLSPLIKFNDQKVS